MRNKKYKYFFCKKGESWQFQLMPNNSNTQPVAVSSLYSSYQEAYDGLNRFRNFMKHGYNRSNIIFNERKAACGKKISYYVFFTKTEYVSSARFYQKKEINNGLKRMEEHFDAPIKMNN